MFVIEVSGPDLRGGGREPRPQASHQQGASLQTLHIFFIRDMCVRDFRLLQLPMHLVTPSSELGPQAPHQLNPALLIFVFFCLFRRPV